MNKELEFMLEIVKEAGKMIPDDFVVQQKGSGYDLLTDVDLMVEQFLIDKIKKEYPTFDIVSEEFNNENALTENCFVIDPIDGTINFANKLPFWGIQVACVKNGKTIASVINLVKQNELFYADENKAYLNGKEIRVSQYKELKNAVYSVAGRNVLASLKRMKKYSVGQRNLGALCISLAYVACGRMHGVSFGSDQPWDYLPGLHLVQNAGGKIIDKAGAHIGACNQEFADILEKETARLVNPPNVFILHSLNGDTLDFWGVDVEEKMKDCGLKVFMPQFPIRADSSFEKFDKILNEYLKDGQLNQESIIIAHSIGNPYFIRFAKKHNFVPKGYIAVAPGAWKDRPIKRTDYIVEVSKQAYPKQEDFDFVKENLKIKHCFYSDETDKELNYFEEFIEAIGAEGHYLKGYLHFGGYDRIYKIPELIELLKGFIK